MAINPLGGPASPFVNNRFQAFQSQEDFDRMRNTAFSKFSRAFPRMAGKFGEPEGGGRTGLANPVGIGNFNTQIFGNASPNLDWQSIQTWSPEYRRLLETSLLEKIRPTKQVDAMGRTIKQLDATGKPIPGQNKSYWASPVILANPFGTY